MSTVIVIVLTLLIVYYVVSPLLLLRGVKIQITERSAINKKEQLQRKRQLLLDLELDQQTGKISEKDYLRLRAKLE